MLAEPGGLFPTPFPLVSPGECCAESPCASKVLEATGASHGYREGLGATVTDTPRGMPPPGAEGPREARRP